MESQPRFVTHVAGFAPGPTTPLSCDANPTPAHSMPFHVQADADRSVIDVIASDPIAFDEVIGTIRLVADHLADRQWGVLTDFRSTTYFPTVAELRLAAQEFIRLRPVFAEGVAFIVANDRHYSLGKLLTTLTDRAGVRLGVFRDTLSARQWLGIDGDE